MEKIACWRFAEPTPEAQRSTEQLERTISFAVHQAVGRHFRSKSSLSQVSVYRASNRQFRSVLSLLCEGRSRCLQRILARNAEEKAWREVSLGRSVQCQPRTESNNKQEHLWESNDNETERVEAVSIK